MFNLLELYDIPNRQLLFIGNGYISYSDYIVLYEKLREIGELPDSTSLFGTIRGAREKVIEDVYSTEFFGRCFGRKEGSLLNGPSEEFPEVLV